MKSTKNGRGAEKILWIECVGFSLLILLSWLDELASLPHLIFGGPQQPMWQEAALESIAISSVWLVVFVLTRRILQRSRFLEKMLTMCAWCRKFEQSGEWVSLENYCATELGLDISHGMCPKCGRQLLGERTAEATN